MNSKELKSERLKQNKNVSYMAKLIGKDPSSYRKKERGDVSFSIPEIVAISNDLRLSPSKFSAVFCDSKLLFSIPQTVVNTVL